MTAVLPGEFSDSVLNVVLRWLGRLVSGLGSSKAGTNTQRHDVEKGRDSYMSEVGFQTTIPDFEVPISTTHRGHWDRRILHKMNE
jgi:hypothetical protein